MVAGAVHRRRAEPGLPHGRRHHGRARCRPTFSLSAQALGIFSGAFHFSFGADAAVHGHRHRPARRAPHRAGRLSARRSRARCCRRCRRRLRVLVAGQVLIGVGCAPAFLVCTVFIARHFPAGALRRRVGPGAGRRRPRHAERPARRWRGWCRPLRGAMGFLVLAAAAALAWLAIWSLGARAGRPGGQPRESVPEALRQFGALFALPHTLGILVLGAVDLRGLHLAARPLARAAADASATAIRWCRAATWR